MNLTVKKVQSYQCSKIEIFWKYSTSVSFRLRKSISLPIFRGDQHYLLFGAFQSKGKKFSVKVLLERSFLFIFFLSTFFYVASGHAHWLQSVRIGLIATLEKDCKYLNFRAKIDFMENIKNRLERESRRLLKKFAFDRHNVELKMVVTKLSKLLRGDLC